jgi:hypothetical protein
MKNNIKNLVKKYQVTNKEVIKLSNTLQKFNFSVTALSDGLINKNIFLTPCIVLAPINMPKFRLNNERQSLKIYFNKYGRKRLEDFRREEYDNYLSFAEKAGETEEYKVWRESGKKIISDFIKKVDEFNSLNKSKIKLSVLRFTEGSVRLDFGNQKKDMFRLKYSKVGLERKNEFMSLLFFQFSLFNDFLSKNI